MDVTRKIKIATTVAATAVATLISTAIFLLVRFVPWLLYALLVLFVVCAIGFGFFCWSRDRYEARKAKAKREAEEEGERLYIFRNRNGLLWVSPVRPTREEADGCWPVPDDADALTVDIDDRLYPDVTWENSPKELIIKR
jgi:hypothetical protein